MTAKVITWIGNGGVATISRLILATVLGAVVLGIWDMRGDVKGFSATLKALESRVESQDARITRVENWYVGEH